ncbi:MAG: sensor histidine kinase [Acidimicrobiales bacterium]
MSLRSKLLATILGLLALTILILDLATYSSLRSFLFQRLDQQLESSVGQAGHALGVASTQSGAVPENALGQWPVGTYLEFLNSTGVGVIVRIGGSMGSVAAAPKLTVTNHGHLAYNFKLNQPTTIASSSPNPSFYRIFATQGPVNDALGNGIVVIALPESTLEATLHRLLVVELLVSFGVLLLLSSVGGALLRIGLRPLQDMTDTASAIADGGLERRVEARGTGSEVTKLANALNKMLSRIQGALDKSRNSEDRLRVFIADVSHELRTPLTSIQGYAELYKHGALRDEADLKKAIDRIESESKRMSVLVEDLLLLARMDQNRPLVLEEVNMTAIVEAAAHDASVVEPARPITTVLEAPYWVLGDRNQLTQVVANLLSNVRSHTPAGSAVAIRVYRISRLQPIPRGARSSDQVVDLFGSVDPTIKGLIWESFLRIEVEDHGPGLEKEQLQRVFERFYRSDASRSRAAGGAGLGLSLVAAITQAHGGRAWVMSDGPGTGATFGFDLPLLDTTNQEESLDNVD